MTSYILTAGEYSDYHIIGVFSTKELAEKARVVTGGDIEEYTIDEIGEDGRFRFFVRFEDDTTSVWFERNEHENINKVKEINSYYDGVSTWYVVIVMAEDKIHAVKIAADLVAQYKATH